MQYVFDKCCKVLEDEKIDYIPLKGAVLMDYYPEKWMRLSIDIDILVRPEDHERAAKAFVKNAELREPGFSTGHDISLRSENEVAVELHFAFFDEDLFPKAQKILSNVWCFANPVAEGSHKYQLESQMLYLHHIVHLAKHIKLGGGGIKDFIDLYLLDMHGINFDSCKVLLEETEMFRFAEMAEKLARVWFGDEEHDEITRCLADFVMSGGIFGSRKNSSILEKRKSKTKLKFYASHLFVSYDYLKNQYPIIKKRSY